MKKCAIYLRVSTDKQETDRQKEELLAYAKTLGFQVVDVLEDIESGLNDTRPAFQKLLTYTKREIDVVLVWELSRIGRKTSTVIKSIEDWTEQGICFISKKENLVSLDNDGKINPNTKLFLSVMATVAEMEAATIKERMRSGKIHKLRNGGVYADKTPYGYTKIDGRYVINEEEAENVKKAFQMRKDGISISIISKEIGVKAGAVDHMLHNECYRGTARNSYVPDMVFTTPKIVNDELWNAVQKTFTKIGSRGYLKDVPLRKKIVCPICGRHLAYEGPTSNKGRIRPARYYCNNSVGSRDGIPHPPGSHIINAEKLDRAIEQLVIITPERAEINHVSPESIEAYIRSLQEKSQETERSLNIQERKYDAVATLLNEAEKRVELRKISELKETLTNLQVELDAANIKLANAIALSSAIFLPRTQNTKWSDFVKEVRIIEYSEGYKKFEVELQDGQILYTDIVAPRGYKSVENKEAQRKKKKR